VEGFQTEINNLIRAYGRRESLATAPAVACGQGMEMSKDTDAMKVNDPEVLNLHERQPVNMAENQHQSNCDPRPVSATY